MPRALLIGGALVVAGIAGALFFLVSGDDDGPPHFSIFDRPAEARDRAPQGAPSLRTEEMAGKLRLSGTMRDHRFYLGQTGNGMCHYIHGPDGSTGGGCSTRPDPFTAAVKDSVSGDVFAFVAVPDGYTEAKVYTGRVHEDELMENGYAAVMRGDASIRFSGPRGERIVELSF